MAYKLLFLLTIPGLLFSAEIKKDYFFTPPAQYNGFSCEKTARLLLPEGHTAVSCDILYDTPTELKDNFSGSIPAYDSDHDEFYPAASSNKEFTVIRKNGYAVFTTTLFPVQYNPVSGKMRYHKRITVAVHTAPVKDPLPCKLFPWTKSLLKNMVDNPDDVEKLSICRKDADDYEYLIVCPDALKSSLGNFIEFNARRCLRTKVNGIDSILSYVAGSNDAEKLRNFIIGEYKEHNIIFVLLAGDDDYNVVNDIPHIALYARTDPIGQIENLYIPADLYYSCLDGTWKAPNKPAGDYGTEDIGWEVYAARFAVDNATELTNMINKTIKYSEIPVIATTENNLLTGEYLWTTGNDTVTGSDFLMEFMGTCNNNGYTTVGFGNNWKTSTLFESGQQWNEQDFSNALNSGKPTWIDHVGHANTNYLLKISYPRINAVFQSTDGIQANFMLLSSSGSYACAFDNKNPGSGTVSAVDCWGEAATTISNGTVAFQGMSRYSFGAPSGTDAPEHRLFRYFHDAVFNKKIHHIEMMQAYAKELHAAMICDSNLNNPASYNGHMKACAYGMNILGDPALSVWTAKPQQLIADYPTPLTTAVFEWDTKKPYTWVALVAGGKILCTQLTGEDGKCIIDEPSLADYAKTNPNGSLKVRVKAHNYLPFEGDLPIDYQVSISNQHTIKSPVTLKHSDNRTVTIRYTLGPKQAICLSLYSTTGRFIKSLADGLKPEGEHTVQMHTDRIPAGVYYIKLSTGEHSFSQKIIIMK